jgi:hypothetical protein
MQQHELNGLLLKPFSQFSRSTDCLLLSYATAGFVACSATPQLLGS